MIPNSNPFVGFLITLPLLSCKPAPHQFFFTSLSLEMRYEPYDRFKAFGRWIIESLAYDGSHIIRQSIYLGINFMAKLKYNVFLHGYLFGGKGKVVTILTMWRFYRFWYPYGLFIILLLKRGMGVNKKALGVVPSTFLFHKRGHHFLEVIK